MLTFVEVMRDEQQSEASNRQDGRECDKSNNRARKQGRQALEHKRDSE